MILLLILLTCLYAADSSPMFDLPPVIMDDTPVKGAPNLHTTIFNPIGKYATDVQYQLIRIPIHFAPIEKAQEEVNIFIHNVLNLVKTRATEIPISQIVHLANISSSMIKTRTKNMFFKSPNFKIFTPWQ